MELNVFAIKGAPIARKTLNKTANVSERQKQIIIIFMFLPLLLNKSEQKRT